MGITVLISPIIIRKDIVKRDLSLLLLVTILAAWQLRDGILSQADGLLLLIVSVAVLGLQIVLSLREGYHEHENEIVIDILEHTEHSLSRGLGSLFVGMLMLVVSSRTIVWGAIELATAFGVSELIIGLTIVAIGTSLPELVSSVSSARKGEHDMALGNIIGSNIFNTLGVVGIAAIIAPITANPIILSRDVLVVGLITLLLVALCVFAFMTKRQFGRTSGTTLVLFFVGYTIWLMQTANL